MFDRFLIYARAKRAVHAGQFEVALRLSKDPAIAAERRAEQFRDRALKGILGRAQARLKDGLLAAAKTDVDLVLAESPGNGDAAALREALERELQTVATSSSDARAQRQIARDLAECGDLEGAVKACGDAARLQPESAEQAAVERLIDGRRKAIAEDLDTARDAIRAADLKQLRPLILRLRNLTTPPAGFAAICKGAAKLSAKDFVARLGATGPEPALLDEIVRESAHTELASDAKLRPVLTRYATELDQTVRSALAGGKLDDAVTAFRGAHRLIQGSAPAAALSTGIDALAVGLQARETGDLAAAAAAMTRAAKSLQCKSCRRVLADLQKAEAAASECLSSSRDLASQGRLLAAREQLVSMLEDWPMLEPLRRQMDILNQQSKDREDRLATAREHAAAGELAAASAQLLGLSGDGQEGREARLLLKDIQSRMDLASEGLAQVRRAVHGPASSREGLRLLVTRLDEIAKVQSDLAELQTTRTALDAEIRGLDELEALGTAFEARDLGRAQAAIAAFDALRSDMLREDRLDARFLEVTDEILRHADQDAHSGRLSGAKDWLAVVQQVGDVSQASRIQTLHSTVEVGEAKAEALLDQLEATSGDPEQLADLLDAAREVWGDSPRLHKIERQVVAQHSHAQAADEVERLAGAGDVRGAQARLGKMPPTPDFLRTRIFDIKQGLARAQGLEDGFLLRVDEGGEYLVLREDSFTIGNVRDAKADVRVLANVSGVHARFKRSLSFHGGMEDRIVAERGEVRVNGSKVDSAVLRSGDVVKLGPAFEFVYRLPGKRSLTAALYLKSGFQVGGTDKILLMKDRGRDGRILVGRAEDAHIRVPHDALEVELFGANDGQIHARYPGKGDMGGKPFSGSHPVTAGSLVRCGDTAFVLQPWNQG